MNVTPDEIGDAVSKRRTNRPENVEGERYYIVRTETDVRMGAIPDFVSKWASAFVELGHPFNECNRGTRGATSCRALPTHEFDNFVESAAEAGYDVHLIEAAAPFKIQPHLAVGQVVVKTGESTLPSPSLEMEGEG